jgi:hypothetical protein
MKTLFYGRQCHFFIDRFVWAWFELWLEADSHDYIATITICTFQIGVEWVWTKPRPRVKKQSHQWILWRQA